MLSKNLRNAETKRIKKIVAEIMRNQGYTFSEIKEYFKNNNKFSYEKVESDIAKCVYNS